MDRIAFGSCLPDYLILRGGEQKSEGNRFIGPSRDDSWPLSEILDRGEILYLYSIASGRHLRTSCNVSSCVQVLLKNSGRPGFGRFCWTCDSSKLQDG